MNLFNATLRSLTPKPTATLTGQREASTPVSMSVRTTVTDATTKQKNEAGDVVKEATAVMYLLKANLGETLTAQLVAPAELEILIDGDKTSTKYQIVHRINREKRGGLAHWEVYLKVMS